MYDGTTNAIVIPHVIFMVDQAKVDAWNWTPSPQKIEFLQVCNQLTLFLLTGGIKGRQRWPLTGCFKRKRVDWRLISMVYCGKGLQENSPSVSFSFSFPFFPKIGQSKSESYMVQVIINFRYGGNGIEKRRKRVKRK